MFSLRNNTLRVLKLPHKSVTADFYTYNVMRAQHVCHFNRSGRKLHDECNELAWSPLETNNVARRLESHQSYILIRALRRDIVKFETVIDRSFELLGDDTIPG